MDKVQYSVFRRDTRNAAGKAKWDAADILLDMGFRELYAPSDRRFLRVIQQLIGTTGINGDTLLAVQYPANIDVFYRILARKKVRTFALIHDLQHLRGETTAANELGILSTFFAVVSHNPAMTKALQEIGYNGRIVELGLFDYLGFEGNVSQDYDTTVVAFAGNLLKAGFLNSVASTGLSMNLYGIPRPSYNVLV